MRLGGVILALLCWAIQAHAADGRNLAVAAGGSRIALVLGNDSYQQVTPLRNARADAQAIAQALEATGFRVILKLDAGEKAMKEALRGFKAQVRGGDEAVFYYSGHGVQLGSTNYLLPVDIKGDNEDQVRDDAIPLQRVLDDLQEQKARFTLAIVDACRDNPFKKTGRAIGGRGLAPTTAATGQMVIYSAGTGQQALDRLSDADSQPNGLFTRVFLKEMEKPGVPVDRVLRGVRDEVVRLARSVGHEQVPALYDQALGDFYFRPGDGTQVASLMPAVPLPARVAVPARPAVPPAPTFAQASSDPETAFWNEVKASGTRDYYEVYLKQYPKGKFQALAKLELKRLDDLEKAQAAREEAERKLAEEQAKQEAARIEQEAREADQRAWESAQRGDTEAAYRQYQTNNPQGRHLAQAQTRLKELETDDAYRSETEHWQRVSSAKDSATVQGYLDRYPSGRYVPPAQAQLAALKKEEAEMLRPGRVFKDCVECPEMVVIQAGSFEMGGTKSKEEPVHTVAIAKSFALGKTEVTQGQWRALMGSNPSKFKTCGDECPVEQVTWDDAQAYVKQLSQKTGKHYRLPSEAEWEYACRAGGRHEYCGSDSVNSVAWHGGGIDIAPTAPRQTTNVGRKQANAWGLYDMSGNVWEWVEDCSHDNYNGAPSDGRAWTTEECFDGHVLRGGSWDLNPFFARSAARGWGAPTIRFSLSEGGFRPARMLP